MPDALAQIVDLISANTDVDASEITSDTDFESLGFDSLSFTEMTVVIKRKFGVIVSEDALARCQNVGAMAGLVSAEIGKS